MMEAIESTYFDKCDVYRMDNVSLPNGSVKQQRIKVYENIPCALSIGSRPVLNSLTENDYRQGEALNRIQTQDRLYLSPFLIINQGDEIQISHYGRQIKATAGNPFLYDTHQILIAENINYA